jgi:zinc transport system ATP-binding protein
MKQTACGNLELLGVKDLSDRPFRELSGGQQQRVLLARALCATEHLLLLDEPTNGLDASATADMYEVIKSLNNQGMTVIMITHDVKKATENASYILHLNSDGHFFGATDEYLQSGFGNALMNGGHK